MAKATKAGGSSFNDDEMNDPSPPPVVQRAMLGGEPRLAGTHSSQGLSSDKQSSTTGSPSHLGHAHTTESLSDQMEGEDFTANSTDGDGQSEMEKPYVEWTVAELRDECFARELPVSGRKDELITRLEEDDSNADDFAN